MIARALISSLLLAAPTAMACRTVNRAAGEAGWHSRRAIAAFRDRDVVLDTRRYLAGELTVEVSRPDVVPKRGRGENEESYPAYVNERNQWRARIAENVEFAISQYPRRGWSESFFAELRQEAQREWMSSTYITVRDGKGRIVGTLRLISSVDQRYRWLDPRSVEQAVGGKWSWQIWAKAVRDRWWGYGWKTIPLERGLGVNVARPYWNSGHLRAYPESLGEAIEPGNFAVEKGASPEVMRVLMREFVREVFDSRNSADYNMYGKLLYTYGDERGKGLYVPSGFEVVDESDPIDHKGIKWWVLRMTPLQLKQKIDRLERRPKWSAEDLEELRLLMEAFSRAHELRGVMRDEEGEAQHGLRSPTGYAVEARARTELERWQSDLREALRAKLDHEFSEGSAPPELVAPYEELLVSLNTAYLTQAYPIRQNDYWDIVLFHDGDRPMRVGGIQVMPTVVFSMNDPVGKTVRTAAEVVPADQFPEGAYRSEGYFVAEYGPFWESKKVLHTLLLRDSGPYHRNLERFNDDLIFAIVQSVNERRGSGREELSSKEMNAGLLVQFWSAYRNRGGR